MAEQKKPGLGSNPLLKLFGSKPTPAPETPASGETVASSLPKSPRKPVAEKPTPQPGKPAFTTPPSAPMETAETAPPLATVTDETASGADTSEGDPTSVAKPRRIHRIRRRHRSRQGSDCSLHPGESKRTERVTIWLTPEEREDLELLSMAEGLSDSSLGRQGLLEILGKYQDLIAKARGFRESLTRTSA